MNQREEKLKNDLLDYVAKISGRAGYEKSGFYDMELPDSRLETDAKALFDAIESLDVEFREKQNALYASGFIVKIDARGRDTKYYNMINEYNIDFFEDISKDASITYDQLLSKVRAHINRCALAVNDFKNQILSELDQEKREEQDFESDGYFSDMSIPRARKSIQTVAKAVNKEADIGFLYVEKDERPNGFMARAQLLLARNKALQKINTYIKDAKLVNDIHATPEAYKKLAREAKASSLIEELKKIKMEYDTAIGELLYDGISPDDVKLNGKADVAHVEQDIRVTDEVAQQPEIQMPKTDVVQTQQDVSIQNVEQPEQANAMQPEHVDAEQLEQADIERPEQTNSEPRGLFAFFKQIGKNREERKAAKAEQKAEKQAEKAAQKAEKAKQKEEKKLLKAAKKQKQLPPAEPEKPKGPSYAEQLRARFEANPMQLRSDDENISYMLLTTVKVNQQYLNNPITRRAMVQFFKDSDYRSEYQIKRAFEDGRIKLVDNKSDKITITAIGSDKRENKFIINFKDGQYLVGDATHISENYKNVFRKTLKQYDAQTWVEMERTTEMHDEASQSLIRQEKSVRNPEYLELVTLTIAEEGKVVKSEEYDLSQNTCDMSTLDFDQSLDRSFYAHSRNLAFAEDFRRTQDDPIFIQMRLNEDLKKMTDPNYKPKTDAQLLAEINAKNAEMDRVIREKAIAEKVARSSNANGLKQNPRLKQLCDTYAIDFSQRGF